MKNNKLLKILILTIVLLIVAVVALFILKKMIKPVHYKVKIEDVKLVQSFKKVTNNEDLDYSIIDTITNEKDYEKFIQDNNIDRNDKLNFKYYNYSYLKITKKSNNQKIDLLEYVDDIECEKIILKFQANYGLEQYEEETLIYEVPVSKEIINPKIEIDWEKIEVLSKPVEPLIKPKLDVYNYSTQKENEFNESGYEIIGVSKSKEEYENLVTAYQLEYYDENINIANNYMFIMIDTMKKYANDSILYKGYKIINNEIIHVIDISNTCGVLAPHNKVLAIPIDKEYENMPYKIEITTSKRYCDPNVAYKPILYLYPENKMDITINFAHEEYLTTTYPKFNNNWKVTAYPNGNLIDQSGKYYYALYWEEKYTNKVDFSEGFYVTKENAIEFLEEKLSIIGLNDKERNECIMYWLPILETNEKNLVYFELTKSKQNYNELIISPKPDCLLRMTIHVKKVDKEYSVKEQKLETFERKGFVAIEWGGVKY